MGDGADSVFLMLPFPGPVLDAIRAAGADVPQDVIVVGRGEATLEAQTNPPTSAMSMMAVNTGRLIVQGVDRFLAGETGIDMVAPHELIVRQSSLRFVWQ